MTYEHALLRRSVHALHAPSDEVCGGADASSCASTLRTHHMALAISLVTQLSFLAARPARTTHHRGGAARCCATAAEELPGTFAPFIDSMLAIFEEAGVPLAPAQDGNGAPCGPLRAWPGGLTCARIVGNLGPEAPAISCVPSLSVVPLPPAGADLLICSHGV